MRVQVHCFARDNKGERVGAGCRRECSGCAQDIGFIWIGETPPDYLRGGDKKHKSKKYERGVEDGLLTSARIPERSR